MIMMDFSGMKRRILLVVLLSSLAVGVGECASAEPNSLWGLRLGDSMYAAQAKAEEQGWSLVEELRGSSPSLVTREYRERRRNRIYASFLNERLFRITLYLEDDHPSDPAFNGFMKDLTDEYGEPQVIVSDTNYEWRIGRVTISLSRYSSSHIRQFGLTQTCELELRVNQPVEYNLNYF